MSNDEITRLIISSFLGGGIFATVITSIFNWFNTNRLERKRKRLEFTRLQLQELYGPLQFFTAANAELFKLNRKFHEAYDAEYVDKKWSENEITQERVHKSASETLAISNEYIKQVVENNGRILEILTNHYSFIDPRDAETFAQFTVDYTRHKTEYGEGALKTPIAIYKLVGEVSFMRPEFIEAVDRRFKEKQAELKKLLA